MEVEVEVAGAGRTCYEIVAGVPSEKAFLAGGLAREQAWHWASPGCSRLGVYASSQQYLGTQRVPVLGARSSNVRVRDNSGIGQKGGVCPLYAGFEHQAEKASIFEHTGRNGTKSHQGGDDSKVTSFSSKGP